ncbi:FtsX-like permease family protein [Streptomyces niveus]|uniref:ABC transporter permease n=1 Tax=Streptomyces niveus TaxID=193462 RepID=A0ABZ2A885_STRNV|nr:FtsX-like permease family protein [Streptomyces niveus]
MLTVAVQTLRTRWVSFLGTVVALVLGVAQIAAMGLLLATVLDLPDRPAERFAHAPAVVLPTDPAWDPAHHDLGVRSLPAAKGVSPRLLREVSAAGKPGDTVVDRAFYAQLAGGGDKDQVGHPWPVARFGGYTLTDGAAPATDREIVVAAGQARTGDKVTVLTAADGVGRYTVSGTVPPVEWENAVFFTDTEAARLAPRVNALVTLGPADSIRAVTGNQPTGTKAAVLTGRERHLADASAERDREALDNTATLVPVMASVAGTTAVFVVASTFAFAVVQRRREIALLRTVGATPRQVRRMIRNEALLVGAAASGVGTVLGLYGARWLADLLIGMGVSPPWFQVEPSLRPTVVAPLAAAFLVGLVVALCGAVAASRRAARIRPAEALGEASVDDAGMTPARRLLGVTGGICGIGLTAWIAVRSPGTVLSPNTYVVSLLVPVLVAAVLAPLAVGPLTRLLMWPFRRLAGPTAMLVRESVLTSRRRTAATAAPVLLTVGLTLSLFAATDSIGTARDNGPQQKVSSPYGLAPDGTPGISPRVVAKVARVDGVRIAAPVLTTVYTRDENRIEENDALAVDTAALKDMLKLRVTHGSLGDADPNSMVVPDRWGIPVGTRVQVLMADGTEAALRVSATYRALSGEDVAYLPPRFAGTGQYARDGLARRAYISLKPGTDPATATAAIGRAVAGTGARLTTTDALAASESTYTRQLTEVRQRSTAVIILLFCFVAILNTLLMATADRRRDLTVLRLTGATPRQVVRFFLAESLVTVAVGVTLALLASAVNLAGLWIALLQLFGTAPIVVPYAEMVAVAAASTLLAVAGTLLPVGAALRTRRGGAPDPKAEDAART